MEAGFDLWKHKDETKKNNRTYFVESDISTCNK